MEWCLSACEARHCALTALMWHLPSRPTHAWPGQAGWSLMAATQGMDWTAGAKSISENERSRIAATLGLIDRLILILTGGCHQTCARKHR